MSELHNRDVAGSLPASEIRRSLKRDPDGRSFTALGDDGVLRVVHSREYHVIDAYAMTPRQIKDYLDEWPWSREAEERYRGVDGSKVPREQWLNPPPGILPKKPSEEERAERRRIWEEQMKEREKNGGSGSGACCRPGVKQSDHKILE